MKRCTTSLSSLSSKKPRRRRIPGPWNSTAASRAPVGPGFPDLGRRPAWRRRRAARSSSDSRSGFRGPKIQGASSRSRSSRGRPRRKRLREHEPSGAENGTINAHLRIYWPRRPRHPLGPRGVRSFDAVGEDTGAVWGRRIRRNGCLRARGMLRRRSRRWCCPHQPRPSIRRASPARRRRRSRRRRRRRPPTRPRRRRRHDAPRGTIAAIEFRPARSRGQQLDPAGRVARLSARRRRSGAPPRATARRRGGAREGGSDPRDGGAQRGGGAAPEIVAGSGGAPAASGEQITV